MQRKNDLLWSAVAWLVVFAFWLVVTRTFHPNWDLALIVTASLIGAYAAASYINHLMLLPALHRTGDRKRYLLSLIVTMLALTAVALTIIRIAYFVEVGPDPDPVISTIRHYAIDLFGMAVHVAGAAIAVWYVKRVRLAAAGIG